MTQPLRIVVLGALGHDAVRLVGAADDSTPATRGARLRCTTNVHLQWLVQ